MQHALDATEDPAVLTGNEGAVRIEHLVAAVGVDIDAFDRRRWPGGSVEGMATGGGAARPGSAKLQLAQEIRKILAGPVQTDREIIVVRRAGTTMAVAGQQIV